MPGDEDGSNGDDFLSFCHYAREALKKAKISSHWIQEYKEKYQICIQIQHF
jgi:hypothetical protein